MYKMDKIGLLREQLKQKKLQDSGKKASCDCEINSLKTQSSLFIVMLASPYYRTTSCLYSIVYQYCTGVLITVCTVIARLVLFNYI